MEPSAAGRASRDSHHQINLAWREGHVASTSPDGEAARVAGPRAGSRNCRSALVDCATLVVQSGAVTPEIAVVKYTETLEAMAALGEGTSVSAKWNRLVRANHDAYLVLRESDDGRRVIETGMDHEAATVRVWAAGHVLLWNEAAARPVHAALVEAGGLASVSAEYTLREFDRGRLSHDW